MDQPATQCAHQGCGRMTKARLCYQHVEAQYPKEAPRNMPPIPDPPDDRPPPMRSQQDIWQGLDAAIPGPSQLVHPQNIRGRLKTLARQAVSAETYRHMQELDVFNAHDRDLAARQVGVMILDRSVPAANSMTDHEAEEVSRTLSDQYGMSLDDSTALLGYGLKAEWEMARAQGIPQDEYGTPYSLPLHQYVDSAAPRFIDVAAMQYRLELGRFHTVIHTMTGHMPLNLSPLELGISPGQSDIDRERAQQEYRTPPPPPQPNYSRPDPNYRQPPMHHPQSSYPVPPQAKETSLAADAAKVGMKMIGYGILGAIGASRTKAAKREERRAQNQARSDANQTREYQRKAINEMDRRNRERRGGWFN